MDSSHLFAGPTALAWIRLAIILRHAFVVADTGPRPVALNDLRVALVAETTMPVIPNTVRVPGGVVGGKETGADEENQTVMHFVRIFSETNFFNTSTK